MLTQLPEAVNVYCAVNGTKETSLLLVCLNLILTFGVLMVISLLCIFLRYFLPPFKHVSHELGTHLFQGIQLVLSRLVILLDYETEV